MARTEYDDELGRNVRREDNVPVTFGLIENFWTPKEAQAIWKELRKRDLVDPAGRIKDKRTLSDIMGSKSGISKIK